MVPLSAGRSQPDRQAGIVAWLPFDARLGVSQVKGSWMELALPDHRLVWIPQQEARLAPDTPTLDTFYAAAQGFLKVPYLWGGTASGALDCSGYLYRLFHAYGITLPRDADDQALAGVPVPGEPQRGDLIFTSEKKGGPVTHVVMVWGGGMIIDADSPKGLTIHPFGDVLRTGYQVSVRRILP
jgi:cell wall-associated NlpC family hydrolase